MFRWIVLFENACHGFRFPATEIGNTPADFSGSRVRRGESLNVLSINPKVTFSARVLFAGEVEFTEQNFQNHFLKLMQ